MTLSFALGVEFAFAVTHVAEAAVDDEATGRDEPTLLEQMPYRVGCHREPFTC